MDARECRWTFFSNSSRVVYDADQLHAVAFTEFHSNRIWFIMHWKNHWSTFFSNLSGWHINKHMSYGDCWIYQVCMVVFEKYLSSHSYQARVHACVCTLLCDLWLWGTEILLTAVIQHYIVDEQLFNVALFTFHK